MAENDVYDDYCASVLSQVYGFNPPRAVYPARNRATNSGKYEPDHKEGESPRCMVLAHFADATNILIEYEPDKLQFS